MIQIERRRKFGEGSRQTQRGNILLLMLGIIVVMLVFSYGFLRSMQMSTGASLSYRQQQLADLAATMGLQHAIAVSLHEYAMVNERRDASTMPAVSRIDSPSKNVFNILSPRLSNQRKNQQPVTPWDLAPDVSFQDLYGIYSGSYQRGPTYGLSTLTTMILGYSNGWTMHRGYGRLFEANRFDYRRQALYDPSTYDSYDLTPLSGSPPSMPDASVVASPFPPVDPFVNGRPILKAHDLDNPLWLDASFRPVSMSDARNVVTNAGATLARYRLRYAICSLDMSPTLWVNTDPAWLLPSEKSAMRNAYKEALYSVAAQQYSSTKGGDRHFGTALEGVMLGYGQFCNVRFDGTSGLPLEWPSRGGTPMWYRRVTSSTREFGCVHGSPYMSWFDGPAWKGAPLTSWNDLSFALQSPEDGWVQNGENGPSGLSYADGFSGVRANHLAQRAATPFGRPYEAATDHPWQVNILSVPMRVLEPMMAAYVPPASRAIRQTWANARWLGRGVDLFTDAFKPGGVTPFTYGTPLNRDYWTSPASARPDPNQIVVDTRPSSDRYPGEKFFYVDDPTPKSKENGCQRVTRWLNVGSDPWQVESHPNVYDRTEYNRVCTGSLNGAGVDGLGRHIVFYSPYFNATSLPRNWNPATGNYTGYLSACMRSDWHNLGWTEEFSPTSPFSVDMNNGFFGTDYGFQPGNEYPGAETSSFRLYPRVEKATDITPLVPNSYWNRVSVAFAHAVLVTQIANLSWADPADARSQKFWPSDPGGYQTSGSNPDPNNDAAGIIYNPTPHSANTVDKNTMRKGPGRTWNPAAPQFASLEDVDRQFLANLGESFDAPGTKPASVARAERPPRFSRNTTRYNGQLQKDQSGPASQVSFGYGSYLWVGEYWVTNNIRSLLLPMDRNFIAPAVPPASTFGTCNQGLPARGVMTIANPPPHGLWLLDEWNALSVGGYDPENVTEKLRMASTGPYAPTPLARTRAKLMERVLNDWRMSFLGSAKGYIADFRAKDFDGDGLVFCSGYLGTVSADADTGLACWQPADANGNGPGAGIKPGDPAYVNATTADVLKKLTVFSLTGSLAFVRSHQYKILVRGELFDNVYGKAVAEKYLETALLVDPDNNIVRSDPAVTPNVLPAGLGDSAVIMQRPIHNYYRGYLSDTYP
jgi:hypothetical protein